MVWHTSSATMLTNLSCQEEEEEKEEEEEEEEEEV